jgi:hypothetical protein
VREYWRFRGAGQPLDSEERLSRFGLPACALLTLLPFDQSFFLFCRSRFGKHFTATENVQHCLTAECASLPRGNNDLQALPKE